MVEDSKALVPVQVLPAVPIAAMREHFQALSDLRTIMKPGIDYGTIPGCGDKPTLKKPGAEKALKNFYVHVTDVPIEDLSTIDAIRYRVKCIGQTPDGVIRGVGIGEASTDEEKYRWRRAVCDEEYNATSDERRRVKYQRKGNRVAQILQVRTHPADQANTVLKMAKKRALVDLALTATAASEFFSQDLEDQPDYVQEQDPGPPPPRREQPPPPPPEPETPSSRQVAVGVKRACEELELKPEDVTAAAKAVEAPEDWQEWTVEHGLKIIAELERRAGLPR